MKRIVQVFGGLAVALLLIGCESTQSRYAFTEADRKITDEDRKKFTPRESRTEEEVIAIAMQTFNTKYEGQYAADQFMAEFDFGVWEVKLKPEYMADGGPSAFVYDKIGRVMRTFYNEKQSVVTDSLGN